MTTPITLSCSADVLHVSRAATFDVRSLFATPSLVKLARSLVQQDGARWMGTATSDVITCTMHKDVDAPAGVVQVHLKPRVDYLRVVRPGDLLVVFMDDQHRAGTRGSGTLVTICIVDSVRQSTTVENNVEIPSVMISARDLGVVLAETSVVFDASFSTFEHAYFTGTYFEKLFGKSGKFAASPMENVLTMLKLIYDFNATQSTLANRQWQLRTSKDSTIPLASLIDVTTFVQRVMPGYTIGDPKGALQSGNVWALLSSYANRCVNEMFVDVRDPGPAEDALYQRLETMGVNGLADAADADRQRGVHAELKESQTFRKRLEGSRDPVAALVLRQRPYDTETFNALPVNLVRATEVETDDVGYSSHDLYSWISLRFPAFRADFQEFVGGVLVAMDYVQRYGLRKFDAETRYNYLSSGAAIKYGTGAGQADFSDVVRFYGDLFATWWAANDHMLAGSLTMRFRPSIRCGTRLRLARHPRGHAKMKVFDFYVQGVQHAFTSDVGGSRTTLTLTRGVEVGGDGLENQLYWDGRAAHLPADIWARYTQAGFAQTNQPNPSVKTSADHALDSLFGGGSR